MAVQSPYLLPGMSPSAVVQNPAVNQIQDTSLAPLAVGRQNDLLVSQIHGKYGVAAHRGMLFQAAATTAASTIAIVTTTSACTFSIVNPAGSGINMELCRFTLGILGAGPGTANNVGFSLVPPTNAISGVTKMPDPITAGGHAVNCSGTAPQGYVASVITYASALTVAANWGVPMFWFPATWQITAAVATTPMFYDFDGTLILPPGWSAALVASTAWAANTVVPGVSWIEYRP
jgi:hypothetical protein